MYYNIEWVKWWRDLNQLLWTKRHQEGQTCDPSMCRRAFRQTATADLIPSQLVWLAALVESPDHRMNAERRATLETVSEKTCYQRCNESAYLESKYTLFLKPKCEGRGLDQPLPKDDRTERISCTKPMVKNCFKLHNFLFEKIIIMIYFFKKKKNQPVRNVLRAFLARTATYQTRTVPYDCLMPSSLYKRTRN